MKEMWKAVTREPSTWEKLMVILAVLVPGGVLVARLYTDCMSYRDYYVTLAVSCVVVFLVFVFIRLARYALAKPKILITKGWK